MDKKQIVRDIADRIIKVGISNHVPVDALREIERFVMDRNIHKQKYDSVNLIANIQEELFELLGYDVPKSNRLSLRKWTMRAMKLYAFIFRLKKVEPTEHDEVDAIADINVFTQDALLKKGYIVNCVLAETAKEINSRTGSIIDGKFTKDTTSEAKAVWYQADYTECKRK